MRRRREFHHDRLSRPDFATDYDDPHDPRLPNKVPGRVSIEYCGLQSRHELIDLSAGAPKARHLHDRGFAKMQPRAGGEPQQVDSACSDIFTDLARQDLESLLPQLIVQLGMDKVHLSQVWFVRRRANARPVFYGYSHMSVTLDSQAGDQPYRALVLLAERMALAPADGSHNSFHAPILA